MTLSARKLIYKPDTVSIFYLYLKYTLSGDTPDTEVADWPDVQFAVEADQSARGTVCLLKIPAFDQLTGMTEAVYFDLDGTLFDDRQYIRGGLEHAGKGLAAETGTDLTDEFIDAYFEREIRESTFDTVLREHGQPLDLVPMLVKAYHDNSANLSPFNGVRATLDALEVEHRLGLITGGTNGQEKLERLKLDKYFETVFVGPKYGASKRDPEIFEAALNALAVSANDAVYVGDRPPLDFPQPNQLGMETVRVRTGRFADADATGIARPEYTIETLSGLPTVLDKIESVSTTEQ